MRTDELIILGIESSCDETALSVVRGTAGNPPEILSQVLFSQTDEHAPYGGVVPEIAARSHAQRMPSLLSEVMQKANLNFSDLSAVACTFAPGLIGGVIVGVMTAKGICVAANKPLVGVNHLEGHALSPKITHHVPFPYLLLLASGGHCQILIVKQVGDYYYLGGTIDDAAGEAFDKVAKILNISQGYSSGGAAVEDYARHGNIYRFVLPRPLNKTQNPDFSFSGLKTAVMRMIENGDIKTKTDIYDLCASFQYAVTDCIVNRMQIAIDMFKDITKQPSAPMVIAGGVAANIYIRNALQNLATDNNMTFLAPPLRYCTDNGVMIAYAGLERFARGWVSPLNIKPLARLAL